MVMNARFLHPSARRDSAAAQAATGEAAIPAAAPAELADCCPAKAVVQVTLARPHRPDLLLCAHHYRASRGTLAAASAAVRELSGTPADIAEWIRLDRPAAVVAAC
jgi:hypothetical protein